MAHVINAWNHYLYQLKDWQELIKGIEPKQTGCGPVYELPNPIDRSNESFAIADMRGIKTAVPHYHTNGETEIYFVLEGSGIIVVGGKEIHVQKEAVVQTPTNTAHYAIPQENLVIAVVNTPRFNPTNNIDLVESNKTVRFDRVQFERLTKGK